MGLDVVFYNIYRTLKSILNFLFVFIENNMEYSPACKGGKVSENTAAGNTAELTRQSCCA